MYDKERILIRLIKIEKNMEILWNSTASSTQHRVLFAGERVMPSLNTSGSLRWILGVLRPYCDLQFSLLSDSERTLISSCLMFKIN